MSALISLGTIIDQSYHRYRENFRPMMSISLWMLAGYPFYLLSLVVFFAAPEGAASLFIATLLSLLGSLAFFVSLIVTFGALVLGAKTAEDGKKISAKAILRASLKKLPHQFLLWVAISITLLASVVFPVPGYLVTATASLPDLVQGLGILMFLLGGLASIAYCLYFGVTLIFAPYALILEEEKVSASLARSFTLTRNHWWGVAFRTILPKLLIIIIALFVQLVLLTFVNIIEAALLSPEAIASAGFSLALAITIKQMVITFIAALAAPLYVIADTYVFQSLVASAGTEASS